MNRRTLLKGLVATAAGVLIPEQVMAEPERRIWALDRTMVYDPDYDLTLRNPHYWSDLDDAFSDMTPRPSKVGTLFYSMEHREVFMRFPDGWFSMTTGEPLSSTPPSS